MDILCSNVAVYSLGWWRSIVTCGSGKNPSLEELTDVEVVATLAFLLSVFLLLLFLPSTDMLSTGGGGKGLGAATLTQQQAQKDK